jgi:hypothetical protein
MTPEDLTNCIKSQDLELRVAYGFSAECLRMHPDDARILHDVTVCGMMIYVDKDLTPGEPEIVAPEEARRRYATSSPDAVTNNVRFTQTALELASRLR